MFLVVWLGSTESRWSTFKGAKVLLKADFLILTMEAQKHGILSPNC